MSKILTVNGNPRAAAARQRRQRDYRVSVPIKRRRVDEHPGSGAGTTSCTVTRLTNGTILLELRVRTQNR